MNCTCDAQYTRVVVDHAIECDFCVPLEPGDELHIIQPGETIYISRVTPERPVMSFICERAYVSRTWVDQPILNPATGETDVLLASHEPPCPLA
jgi:hypothetical protein